MAYYVEKDGKRISKYYKLRIQAVTHCLEHKFYYNGGGDFPGDRVICNELQGNVKIRKVEK